MAEKVLFATYPWAFHVPGGGEVQIMRYLENLPAFGVEPVLFDPWKPQFDEVDLVHFFSTIGGSVHFCDFVRSLGLPLVISSSLWMTPATRDLYQVGEIRDQFGFANAVIPNSETEADMLATVLDLPRDWFLPVYNGVDPQFAEPGDPAGFRQRHGLGEPFLLNIGNIEPRKNQLSLMRAAKKTGRTLVLIGHVRDRDYYRELASEGGEGLRYLGPMAHDDPMLRSAYSACDAFVLPSTLETPGLAALEAAAAGARLVVTREGSTREYFGELATYVDPDSVDDITAGIENALRHSQSRALRDHVLARFTWPIVTGDLVKTYRTVLERAETDKVRA